VSSLPKAINAIYPLKQFGKDALNKNKPEDLPNEYINSFRVKSKDCKKKICVCITLDNLKGILCFVICTSINYGSLSPGSSLLNHKKTKQ